MSEKSQAESLGVDREGSTARTGSPASTPQTRLGEIARIIEDVDARCMAVDGPVTPTLQEMTQGEMSRIYALASGGREEREPAGAEQVPQERLPLSRDAQQLIDNCVNYWGTIGEAASLKRLEDFVALLEEQIRSLKFICPECGEPLLENERYPKCFCQNLHEYPKSCSDKQNKGMLITALSFLAMHHQTAGLEAMRDSKNETFGEEIRENCERVMRHHQEQLHQVGEQIALLGGRNAYPRESAKRASVVLAVDPSRSTPDSPNPN